MERRTVTVGARVRLSPDRLQGLATDPAGWIVDSIDGQFAQLRHVGGGDWRETARLDDLIVDSIDCPRLLYVGETSCPDCGTVGLVDHDCRNCGHSSCPTCGQLGCCHDESEAG